MGQQSILHAVRARSQPTSKRSLNVSPNSLIAEENEEIDGTSKPLAKTLSNLVFSDSASQDDGGAGKGEQSINLYQIVYIFHAI